MSTIYVGPTSAGAADGTSWADRYGSLNAAEDRPIVAGDWVWIGPGVYREQLVLDVSGGAGSVITYCADVTGEHTDGIGGVVRITGSDNDQTGARTRCIYTGLARNYRTFRGFMIDGATFSCVDYVNSTHVIFEDCSFQNYADFHDTLKVDGGSQSNWIIRRCTFLCSRAIHLRFYNTSTVNANHLVENCVFLAASDDLIRIDRIGDIVIKNCIFIGGRDDHIDVNASPEAGHPVLAYNNIFLHPDSNALEAAALGDMIEDYNIINAMSLRSNVAVGANSIDNQLILFQHPLLYAGAGQVSGFKFPWTFGALSEWSQVRALTGSGEPTTDLFGIARPVTASKNSWGPVQFQDMERETGTVRGGSVASLCLHDAGCHQIWVPVANESTTISIYVYREANYAGNNPRLVVKQPGQADDITTDANAASQWNLLTTTFTPAADPPYVIVELVSRNTAGALAYEVFWDDLDVS